MQTQKNEPIDENHRAKHGEVALLDRSRQKGTRTVYRENKLQNQSREECLTQERHPSS